MSVRRKVQQFYAAHGRQLARPVTVWEALRAELGAARKEIAACKVRIKALEVDLDEARGLYRTERDLRAQDRVAFEKRLASEKLPDDVAWMVKAYHALSCFLSIKEDCWKCGTPVVDGYVCTHCGADPGSAPERVKAREEAQREREREAERRKP